MNDVGFKLKYNKLFNVLLFYDGGGLVNIVMGHVLLTKEVTFSLQLWNAPGEFYVGSDVSSLTSQVDH